VCSVVGTLEEDTEKGLSRERSAIVEKIEGVRKFLKKRCRNCPYFSKEHYKLYISRSVIN